MADPGTQDATRDPRQDAALLIAFQLDKASDPPAAAAPGSQDPAPSSGYDEEAEAEAERANAQK